MDRITSDLDAYWQVLKETSTVAGMVKDGAKDILSPTLRARIDATIGVLENSNREIVIERMKFTKLESTLHDYLLATDFKATVRRIVIQRYGNKQSSLDYAVSKYNKIKKLTAIEITFHDLLTGKTTPEDTIADFYIVLDQLLTTISTIAKEIQALSMVTSSLLKAVDNHSNKSEKSRLQLQLKRVVDLYGNAQGRSQPIFADINELESLPGNSPLFEGIELSTYLKRAGLTSVKNATYRKAYKNAQLQPKYTPKERDFEEKKPTKNLSVHWGTVQSLTGDNTVVERELNPIIDDHTDGDEYRRTGTPRFLRTIPDRKCYGLLK